MDIIQINTDDRSLCLLRSSRQIQIAGIDARLFFNIIGKKIVLGLEMMVKAAVGYAALFAYVLDRKGLVALLFQDLFGSPENLCFSFP